jgi:hypothetical protein
MRFYVERNILADDEGKILPVTDATRISYVVVEVGDVVRWLRSKMAGACSRCTRFPRKRHAIGFCATLRWFAKVC